MIAGKVKWFDARRGYGFIEPSDGGRDVFVHISALERAGVRRLLDGQKVIFEIESDRRGRPTARDLRVAA